MFTRTRYQDGCLTTEKRKRGPDVWVFLWRETDTNGERRQRKLTIGSVKEYTESAAKKEIAALRAEINKEHGPETVSRFKLTLGQIVGHYIQKELPSKAHSTATIYKLNLNNWILPRWKDYRLRDVKAVAVEDWLASLTLAPATKAKLRNIMHAVFEHAIRYEWSEKNPISSVRQSAKRQRIPDVLTPEETKALLSELEQPYLAMVVLDAAAGLRRSELLALKWSDLDFEKLEINISRAVVHQVLGDVKTEASEKPVPMTSVLADVLRDWKGRSKYGGSDDWVFASDRKHGKQPLWPDTLLKNHIRPAAVRAGIQKQVGFHTFRHSLATLLKANGEDMKTVQELLRHANPGITMALYAQAVTPAKRAAQEKVLQSFMPAQMAAVNGKGATVTSVTGA
jgi:integrase